MFLELLEFVPEYLAATPALEVFLEIVVLECDIALPVIWRQWIVVQRDEKLGVEAIVMLAMLQSIRMHVSTDDVNVEMIH